MNKRKKSDKLYITHFIMENRTIRGPHCPLQARLLQKICMNDIRLLSQAAVCNMILTQ